MEIEFFPSVNAKTKMHPFSINDFDNPPSPLVEIKPAIFQKKEIKLFIKRDDQIHPNISGNKWRKLKYNLLEASQKGFQKLLTFGGAYSNHLAATAAAGKEYGFETIGIVRGERIEPLNPTLQFVESCGMELKFVTRSAYRNKHSPTFFEEAQLGQTDYYIIPEGGSNCLALKGVQEVVTELHSQLGQLPDYICTACGTGATMAGIIKGLNGAGNVLGIPVLKGDFMQKEVAGLLQKCTGNIPQNWQIFNNYHFGGYAKFTPELLDFMRSFQQDFGIPLDPIYTGKMMYGVFDLASKDFFEKGSTVVMVHTGGLQGVKGFEERFGDLLV